jgi:ribosomal protein S27AE
MDPLNTLKKIRKIIRNTTDRELVRLVLDLQKEVFAIESHNLELASELATLKQQLDLSARMRTRPQSDYYFLEGDDVPFCPKCWESSGNAIHLQAPVSAEGRARRECRVCGETYWEPAITKGRSHAHHA